MTFNIRSERRSKKNHEDDEVNVYVYLDGKGTLEELTDIAEEHERANAIEVYGVSCLVYSAPSTKEERESWEVFRQTSNRRQEEWEARFITELIDKYGDDLSQWPTDIEGWREAKAKGAWPRQ